MQLIFGNICRQWYFNQLSKTDLMIYIFFVFQLCVEKLKILIEDNDQNCKLIHLILYE